MPNIGTMLRESRRVKEKRRGQKPATDFRGFTRIKLSQSEVEGCALFYGGFDPDFAAVSLNDAAHRCEIYTVAGGFGGGMKALEGLKETVCGALVETAAVVLDEVYGPTVFGFLSKFNANVVMVGGVLPGVSHQVVHQDY